jgi:aminoglycoside 3-N-acetyltransferase
MEEKKGLSQEEIVRGLRATGLKAGDVVLVHSAMRTFGHIDGGAETVIAAFLEVIGARGTLVVPTFTFAHEGEEASIIDPASDPSEMGIITETLRRRPDALRSTAYRHSFAAVGPRAGVITEVDPALSSFDLRSSFGVLLALGAQVVLLGMSYAHSTSHHFAEFVCEVPYRHTLDMLVKVRRPDGTVVQQPMIDYQPKPSDSGDYYGLRHPDFNRLGRMLEEQNRVGTAAIGNCAVRRFSMRDLVDLAQVEAEKDYNIFRTPEGQSDYNTPLDFGTVVLSPEMLDGAGRPNQYSWCVLDVSQLKMPD